MMLATLAHGTLLAWTPFINPLNVFHTWWYLLLVPLSFGISVVDKAVRMIDRGGFWREVAVMTVQIVLAMIALAIVIGLLVQLAIPWLPAE